MTTGDKPDVVDIAATAGIGICETVTTGDKPGVIEIAATAWIGISYVR